MTTQGVSTKLTMGIIAIQALVQMAQGSSTKAKVVFGVMITLIAIAFKVAQVVSAHWNKPLRKEADDNGK